MKNKSTKATGLSKLARKEGVTRQAVFNRINWKLRAQAGLCPQCGKVKRDWNKKTGRPYSRCPACRAKFNARMKLLMRKRK